MGLLGVVNLRLSVANQILFECSRILIDVDFHLQGTRETLLMHSYRDFAESLQQTQCADRSLYGRLEYLNTIALTTKIALS